MTLPRLLALVIPGVLVVLGCQPVVVPADVPLTCDIATPCPAGQACVDPDGLCVDVLDPCVFVDGAGATRLAEGASCGDGVICRARACVAPTCGDLIVTSPETCDGGEVCRSDCTACGDGVVDGVEGCDDGASNSDTGPGACRTDCRPAFCGDGVVDPGETCDDDRDCRDDCSFCGDGTVDDDEQCDLGAANSDEAPNACRADCVAAFCGDGVIDDGESCDGGPGCREDCSACGDGRIDDSEVCDTGVLLSDTVPDACRTACVEASCGDDITDGDEVCDDGAGNSNTPGARCRPGCRAGGCGDGILDPGEACDGVVFPAGVAADRCSDDCREVQRCGDRVLQQANNETCDDGNDNPIDGCDRCRGQRVVVEPVVANDSRTRLEVATSFPISAAVDRDGVIYIAENGGRIRRLSTVDGALVNDVIAGNGRVSLTGVGDNGPALLAEFGSPTAVAVDRFGNVYVAEGAGRVRRIDREGIITTIAGGGSVRLSTDPLQVTPDTTATAARFGQVRAVAVDALGVVFFADLETTSVWRIEEGGRLRRIYTPTSGRRVFALAFDGDRLLVSEFQGGDATDNHLLRMSRDGGEVTTVVQSGLTAGNAIAVAGPGVYLVANFGKSHIACIDRSTPTNPVSLPIVAGQNIDTTNVDGKRSQLPEPPVTDPRQAFLHQPRGVALTPDGDIVIAESGGHFVRRVDADFVNAVNCGAAVRTIAPLIGNGTPREANDGGAALTTGLVSPLGIQIVDGAIVVADNTDHRLRTIGDDGVIDTLFGNGLIPDTVPDDVNRLFFPRLIIGDGGDGFFVAGATENEGFYNRGGTAISRLRRGADGGFTSELAVQLNDFNAGGGFDRTDMPVGLAVDGEGLLVSFRERVFGPLLERIALNGDQPVEVPGSLAPRGMARRPDGTIVIADEGRHQILLFDGDALTPIVGSGTEGDSGDGGNPLAAELNAPEGVAIGPDGALYIADTGNHRIRVVRDDVIEAVAGLGAQGGGGDGGPARQAHLDEPRFIAVDESDRVVVVDETRRTIRRIDGGIIDTIAGRTEEGFGPTSSARVQSRALLSVPRDDRHVLLSLGAPGRISEIVETPCTAGQTRDCAFVEPVVAGSADEALPSLPRPANLAAAFARPGGVAFNPVGLRLIVADARGLRSIALDPDGDGVLDEPADWVATPISLVRPDPVVDQGFGGLAFDVDGTLLVVRTTAHCVERFVLAQDAARLDTIVLGDCGRPGDALVDLFSPSDVVVGAAGSIYVADTGNHRVLRRRTDGAIEIVIGESGDPSSTGEGPSAARTFAVHAPRQLDLDRFGNLYIAATSRLRVVTNTGFRAVAGLAANDLEPDGNDGVLNLYGGGDVFPEPETRCIEAVAIVDDEGDVDDGVAWVNDVCFAQVARVRQVTID